MNIPQKDTLVLATRNQGKIKELSVMLAPFGLRVTGLELFPHLPETEESGDSFMENALLKATQACSGTGLVAVADDSGLEVDALDGQPGIYSARFSLLREPGQTDFKMPCAASGGENKTELDARNNAKLLRIMAGTPWEKRRASYVCAVAVLAPNGERLCAEGRWPGYILDAARGRHGFGYDPLFFDPELGLSAAEMTPHEKNLRSHRALALRRLLEFWPGFRSRAGLD